uniref:Uncharacterized protein n=1 Tax=Anguilla anguilla TaxID=7936 RepID=A0A0E9TRP7_ANGAN
MVQNTDICNYQDNQTGLGVHFHKNISLPVQAKNTNNN